MNGIGCKQRDNREVNTICVLVSHHLIMHDIVEASVTTTTVHSQVPTIKTNRQVPVNFLTLFFMPSLFFPAVHKMKPRKCLLPSFILYFILSHSICVPSLFSWYKLFPHTFFSYVFCLFRRCSFHTFGFTLFSVWMLFPVFISFNLEFVRSNCFYWLGPMATITTSPSPATDSYKYTFGN